MQGNREKKDTKEHFGNLKRKMRERKKTKMAI